MTTPCIAHRTELAKKISNESESIFTSLATKTVRSIRLKLTKPENVVGFYGVGFEKLEFAAETLPAMKIGYHENVVTLKDHALFSFLVVFLSNALSET